MVLNARCLLDVLLLLRSRLRLLGRRLLSGLLPVGVLLLHGVLLFGLLLHGVLLYGLLLHGLRLLALRVRGSVLSVLLLCGCVLDGLLLLDSLMGLMPNGRVVLNRLGLLHGLSLLHWLGLLLLNGSLLRRLLVDARRLLLNVGRG